MFAALANSGYIFISLNTLCVIYIVGKQLSVFWDSVYMFFFNRLAFKTGFVFHIGLRDRFVVWVLSKYFSISRKVLLFVETLISEGILLLGV
jgi:hypothetical protein